MKKSASAEKKSVARIYVVTETTESGVDERLVRAASQAQAIRHVVIGRFDAAAASTEDVARLVAAGTAIQTAGEEA